jgi:hypothetical protein
VREFGELLRLPRGVAGAIDEVEGVRGDAVAREHGRRADVEAERRDGEREIMQQPDAIGALDVHAGRVPARHVTDDAHLDADARRGVVAATLREPHLEREAVVERGPQAAAARVPAATVNVSMAVSPGPATASTPRMVSPDRASTPASRAKSPGLSSAATVTRHVSGSGPTPISTSAATGSRHTSSDAARLACDTTISASNDAR